MAPSLDLLYSAIYGDGFVTSRTPGTVNQWVHPGMLNYFFSNNILNISTTVPPHLKFKLLQSPMCNGAIIGVRYNHPVGHHKIFSNYFSCSLVESCIAPPGSNRNNHRQDQSALTMLAYAANQSRVCALEPAVFGATCHGSRYEPQSVTAVSVAGSGKKRRWRGRQRGRATD